MNCYFHPEVPAVGKCPKCGKNLCKECFDQMQTICGERMCIDCTKKLLVENYEKEQNELEKLKKSTPILFGIWSLGVFITLLFLVFHKTGEQMSGWFFIFFFMMYVPGISSMVQRLHRSPEEKSKDDIIEAVSPNGGCYMMGRWFMKLMIIAVLTPIIAPIRLFKDFRRIKFLEKDLDESTEMYNNVKEQLRTSNSA